MENSRENPSTHSEPSNSESANSASKSRKEPIDPRDLVYTGGPDRDPREVIHNPAVAPEMVDSSPEDLRDDLMPKNKDNEQ